MHDLHTEQLWDDFSGRLGNFIRSRVRHPEDARDLLQEVFLKIHLNLASIREARRPEAWIYRVARNAIIDHYRRRDTESVDLEAVAAEVPESGEEDVLRGMVECLVPFIDRLPEKYRKVVEMSELNGVKHKEIAEMLGLSVSAIKSRVVRAREMIRTAFEECCKVKLSPGGVPVRTGDETCEVCGC